MTAAAFPPEVPAPRRLPVRALRFQADYACRSSGACCTAGWSIHVEPEVERGLRDALAGGRLHVSAPRALMVAREGLPDGATAILGKDDDGRCRAFEPRRGNLCAIHRQLGPQLLPFSCRQFPRRALLAPHAVSLSLSHFCPTAAGLLFREDDARGIVEDVPALGVPGGFEGLDAREGTPPLLRPGVLLGWEGHAEWERHAVRRLEDDEGPVEATLSRLRADASRAMTWAPARGPLPDFLRDCFEVAGTTSPHPHFADRLRAFRDVAAAVPRPHAAPGLPPDVALTHERLVAGAWPRFVEPLRRYLAAKAFASWPAVQGTSLGAAVAYLEAAHAVVEVEATRAAAAASRPLDAALLRQAFRDADLLLLHLAAPEALARGLSRDRPPC